MNHLSAAPALDGSGRHALEGAGRPNNDRLFRAAIRHSRAVRFLRVAIPVGLFVCLAGIAAVAYFNPFRHLVKLPFDPAGLVVSGTKITMEAPRLAGYTRDSRPYELTAKAAAQDMINPGVLELKDIHAKVQMKDTATLEMNAATGVYDTKADMLQLTDQIVISSTTGYKGRLQHALVDVKKGKIVSELPVVVEMLNGTLNANTMEVLESGDLITFGGGVVMDLTMQPAKPAAQKAAAE
jgi:lipopolysaccharide export system protein LptC